MLESKDHTTRVLVVDDNEDAAVTLSFLLTAAGYEVRTCFNGEAALAEASGFSPDACVLDISMPGMDGYELARRLRKEAAGWPHGLVLATVTAYGDVGHLKQATDAGFDLHFTKPADPGEVAEQLGECVGSRPHYGPAAKAMTG